MLFVIICEPWIWRVLFFFISLPKILLSIVNIIFMKQKLFLLTLIFSLLPAFCHSAASLTSMPLEVGERENITYTKDAPASHHSMYCSSTNEDVAGVSLGNVMTVPQLVITSKSGGKTILPLDSKPVLTFDGEYMVVNSTLANYSYPIADIADYRFDETTDIIDKSLPPVLSNGHVIITRLPKNSFAHVFSIDGEKVMSQQANSDGVVDIDIDSLPKGVYVVRTQTTKMKVMNK